MFKNIKIFFENDCVKIFVELVHKYDPRQKSLSLNGTIARKMILDKHPDLKISAVPKQDTLLRNKDKNNLSFTWTFDIEKNENSKPLQKKAKKERPRKNFRDTEGESSLTFSKECATVEETADLHLADKGVEEPME